MGMSLVACSCWAHRKVSENTRNHKGRESSSAPFLFRLVNPPLLPFPRPPFRSHRLCCPLPAKRGIHVLRGNHERTPIRSERDSSSLTQPGAGNDERHASAIRPIEFWLRYRSVVRHHALERRVGGCG